MAAAEGAAVPYAPPTSYALGTPMPTAKYSQNLFYQAVSFMLSLVLTMCQLFPVSLLTKAVVVEKEMRLRQTMRIMGLRDRVLYTSWWLSALVQFTLITIICTAVIKIFVVHTATWIVFLFVGLFCLGAISFAFFLSVFFTNVRTHPSHPLSTLLHLAPPCSTSPSHLTHLPDTGGAISGRRPGRLLRRPPPPVPLLLNQPLRTRHLKDVRLPPPPHRVRIWGRYPRRF